MATCSQFRFAIFCGLHDCGDSANLALLGQSAQAPFAALGLIYNGYLARRVNKEVIIWIDIVASLVMVAGVGLAVSNANLKDQNYNLSRIVNLFTRALPLSYAAAMLTGLPAAGWFVWKRDVWLFGVGLGCLRSAAWRWFY